MQVLANLGLQRVHPLLGTCQVSLGRGDLTRARPLLLGGIALTFEDLLPCVLETTLSVLVCLLRLCQLTRQDLPIPFLLLNRTLGHLHLVLQQGLGVGGLGGLLGQFRELILELNLLVVGDVQGLFGRGQLATALFERFAVLLGFLFIAIK